MYITRVLENGIQEEGEEKKKTLLYHTLERIY